MKPVIETHALCKSYHGRPVVDHLNLTVPEGCVYGFLGPNGAGKSTTMKMLLGLVHPTGGSVELLGHTLNKANRIVLLRQTGSLIESPSGYLHLTARENLSIVADLKDVDRKDISRVLEIVHLTKDADRKVGQYSLGMKQRLGIAMALRCMNPQVIVCDELGTQADLKAVEAGLACGVVFVASVHCDTLEALNRKPPTARLLAMGAFETLVLLDGRVNPGHAVKVRTLA